MAVLQLGKFNADLSKWQVKMSSEEQKGLGGLEVSLGNRPK